MNPHSVIFQAAGTAVLTVGLLESGLAVAPIYAVISGALLLVGSAVFEINHNAD